MKSPTCGSGGAPDAPPPNRKENPVFKSVLRNLADHLRHLVYINAAGNVRIDEDADADAVEAIADYLGSAVHYWRSTRGPSLAEREEALTMISALIRAVDAARFELYSRPTVATRVDPISIPSGVSIH